jgi:hypothetical protein
MSNKKKATTNSNDDNSDSTPSKAWIKVCNANGTDVLAYRPVVESSRGAKYVKWCGLFHKVLSSKAEGVRIKPTSGGRTDLP